MLDGCTKVNEANKSLLENTRVIHPSLPKTAMSSDEEEASASDNIFFSAILPMSNSILQQLTSSGASVSLVTNNIQKLKQNSISGTLALEFC